MSHQPRFAPIFFANWVRGEVFPEGSTMSMNDDDVRQYLRTPANGTIVNAQGHGTITDKTNIAVAPGAQTVQKGTQLP